MSGSTTTKVQKINKIIESAVEHKFIWKKYITFTILFIILGIINLIFFIAQGIVTQNSFNEVRNKNQIV